jgi:HTH-type transcriptional regulator / antitoxin HipB
VARPIADPSALGAALRHARRSRGWTQADLAQRAEVSRAFVTDLERGARPRAELARVLAVIRALDKSLAIEDAPPQSSFDDLLDDVLG